MLLNPQPVFGITQWSIFWALLLAITTATTIVNCNRSDANNESPTNVALKALVTSYLFTIQGWDSVLHYSTHTPKVQGQGH